MQILSKCTLPHSIEKKNEPGPFDLENYKFWWQFSMDDGNSFFIRSPYTEVNVLQVPEWT